MEFEKLIFLFLTMKRNKIFEFWHSFFCNVIADFLTFWEKVKISFDPDLKLNRIDFNFFLCPFLLRIVLVNSKLSKYQITNRQNF